MLQPRPFICWIPGKKITLGPGGMPVGFGARGAGLITFLEEKGVMPGKSFLLTAVMPVLALCGVRTALAATPLLGAGFSGPSGAILYDVNPLTGAASNPRPTGIN